MLYERDKALAELDRRGKQIGGPLAHIDAIAKQRRIEQDTDEAQRPLDRPPVGDSGSSTD